MATATYNSSLQTLEVDGGNTSGIETIELPVPSQVTNSYAPGQLVYVAGGATFTNLISSITVANMLTDSEIFINTSGYFFNVIYNTTSEYHVINPIILFKYTITTTNVDELQTYIDFGYNVMVSIVNVNAKYKITITPIVNLPSSISTSYPYNAAFNGGIIIGQGIGPQIDIFNDLQNPSCKELNTYYLDTSTGFTSNLVTAAMNGTVTLILHNVVILDEFYLSTNNQSSLRASMACACAADINLGIYAMAYQNKLYANQPALVFPLTGWTDAELASYAQDIMTPSDYALFLIDFESQKYYQWASWDNMESINYWNLNQCINALNQPYIVCNGFPAAYGIISYYDDNFKKSVNQKLSIKVFNN